MGLMSPLANGFNGLPQERAEHGIHTYAIQALSARIHLHEHTRLRNLPWPEFRTDHFVVTAVERIVRTM